MRFFKSRSPRAAFVRCRAYEAPFQAASDGPSGGGRVKLLAFSLCAHHIKDWTGGEHWSSRPLPERDEAWMMAVIMQDVPGGGR
jgi:hypothetical protein